MNDDVKAAVEWLEECVRVATRNGVPEEADLEAAVLAHLDGEPARTAAAVAAATQEQHQNQLDLLDRIAELEAGAHSLRVTARDATARRDSLMRRCERMDAKQDAEEKTLTDRAEKAEAERDALAHSLAYAASVPVGQAKATHEKTAVDLRLELDALRAQVEAARAGLNVITAWSEGPEVSGSFDEPCSAQYARDTLAAMDGAKPK